MIKNTEYSRRLFKAACVALPKFQNDQLSPADAAKLAVQQAEALLNACENLESQLNKFSEPTPAVSVAVDVEVDI